MAEKGGMRELTSKKSQMELLGLAMVVVLILLATIFSARFFNRQSNVRRGFVESQLASSMIDTILNTDSGCKRLKFSEVIAKCVEHEDVNCDNYIGSACTYSESKLSEGIFKETLEKWNSRFEFIVYTNPGTSLIKIGRGRCVEGDKSRKPGTYFLPTNSGDATLKLYIC